MSDPYLDFVGIGRSEMVQLAPGAKIAAYVHSGGAVSGMHASVESRLYTTLNEGLGQARASKGDVVYILPGHTEDVTGADQMSKLLAGTRIVGGGHGNLRPTLTWTAATSSFLLDVANVTIENCILELAADNSGVSVTAPITVSAAGCGIYGCRVQFGYDTDDLATIGVTTTAAADDFTIGRCFFHGATAAEVTTAIRLIGADRFHMFDTYVDGATSSTTVGVLQMLTTASTQVLVERCGFVNRKALSVHAATGMAAATGLFRDCFFGILDTATLAGLETEGDLMFHNCTTSNLAGEAGGAKVPASTVT